MNHPIRRLALAAAAAASAVLLVTGCSAAAPTPTESQPAGEIVDETLILSLPLDAGSWDPSLAQNGNQAQYWNAVYDTLLTPDGDGGVAAGLATEWTYNDDNTVLTVKLRDDVTFTDGEPFTAEAVKVNLERLRDGTGQNSVMAQAVEDVVIVDDHTAEVRLSQPDPALLTYFTLAGGVMGSPKAIESGDIAAVPVGSGPYTLNTAQSVVGTRYVFDRNPDYWDNASYPYSGLEIRVIADTTARMNALKSGQIDGVGASGAVVAEAESAGLTVSQWPLNRRGLIIADRNGTVVPALGDERVRQAINYAIDAEGILEGIQMGYGTRSTQIFGPKGVAWDESLNEAYPYDPDKAKKLLADAGFADGFDVTMPENPNERSNAVVQQQLAEIGVRVTYEKVDATAYVAEVQSGKYPMFWMSLATGDAWWDLSKQVPATSPWNPFETSTPELDALLEKAQPGTGDEYEKTMREINEYLVDQAWFGIWYLEDVVYFTSPDVAVTPNGINVVPFVRDFSPAS